MRILHLTNKPVFPVIDGGCKAMQQTLECFKENGYEIKHLCISTEKHPFDKNAYPPYILHPETVFISTRLKPQAAFSSLISGKSYHVTRFISSDLKLKLINILSKDSFDVIYLESIYTLPYLELIRNYSSAKLIVRSHNIEFNLWQRVAKRESNPLKRWYINKLANQLKKFELSTLNKVDAIAALSSVDIELFKTHQVHVPITLIPVALPISSPKSDYSNTTFYHLGSMNWKPNQEAVDELLDNIFPEIQQKQPNAELKIAGSFMSQELKSAEQKNVIIEGFVDNPDDFFRSEGIFLCPIYSGSGIRIKLLEAMNVGATIITTELGAEGINTTDGIIIAKNQTEFIESALDLYNNESKRREIGENARKFIRDNYSIQTVAAKLNDFLRSN